MGDQNKNKWEIRRAKGKDIAVGAGGRIYGGVGWDQIKQWQKEFQAEFCPSCMHYDPEKKDFREKGHLNDPNDCKHHWTDIAGQCWNYRNREEAEKEAAAMAQAIENTKESPVLELPNDARRIAQLEKKLKEYQRRLEPYRAPELQMDTICKIAVLSRLLEDGKVVTWDLSREMEKAYGSGYDPMAFQNACAVIDDYCKTGGANMSGGTGLPGA